MRHGTNHFFDRRPAMKRRSLFVAAGLLLLAMTHASAARAQQRNTKTSTAPNTSNTSDLALQNLSRVAASAAEIKAVLFKDAGLMIELKHWVARDATDHGQIVSDSDLTNDAIFERLATDIQFRSIATALVQRYGYILPKLNPESDLAKEHELLIQGRTKWLAQNQEEELSRARQQSIQNRQIIESCVPQLETDCNFSQTRSPTPGGLRQGPQQEEPPSRTAPLEPNSPNAPGGDGNSLLRTALTQTGEDSGGASSQYPTSGSYDSARSFSSLNVSTSESSGLQTAGVGTERPSGPSLAGGNSDAGRTASDGLLAAYGLGTNSTIGTSADVSGIAGTGNNPSASVGVSPVALLQPSNHR